MKVKDIMRKVVIIDSKNKVSEAALKMAENEVSLLVVVDKNKISGVITEDDIIHNMNKLNENVSSVMSKSPKTIEDSEELNETAEIMNREGVHKLPVTSKGKLVGLVTASDLVAYAGELSEVFLFD